MSEPRPAGQPRAQLYSETERARRDASPWTAVQGVLAALQFVVFAVSTLLVWRFLATGEGATIATGSVLAKTLILYSIMITGALWEHDVFGRYLFAPAFFWEDVVSMLVILLHTAYVAVWLFDLLPLQQQMLLALVAYAAYAVNAAQFLYKFRLARRERPAQEPGALAGAGS
jgi:3-vinyl bacteriochlorophyllide hydratase